MDQNPRAPRRRSILKSSAPNDNLDSLNPEVDITVGLSNKRVSFSAKPQIKEIQNREDVENLNSSDDLNLMPMDLTKGYTGEIVMNYPTNDLKNHNFTIRNPTDMEMADSLDNDRSDRQDKSIQLNTTLPTRLSESSSDTNFSIQDMEFTHVVTKNTSQDSVDHQSMDMDISECNTTNANKSFFSPDESTPSENSTTASFTTEIPRPANVTSVQQESMSLCDPSMTFSTHRNKSLRLDATLANTTLSSGADFTRYFKPEDSMIGDAAAAKIATKSFLEKKRPIIQPPKWNRHQIQPLLTNFKGSPNKNATNRPHLTTSEVQTSPSLFAPHGRLSPMVTDMGTSPASFTESFKNEPNEHLNHQPLEPPNEQNFTNVQYFINEQKSQEELVSENDVRNQDQTVNEDLFPEDSRIHELLISPKPSETQASEFVTNFSPEDITVESARNLMTSRSEGEKSGPIPNMNCTFLVTTKITTNEDNIEECLGIDDISAVKFNESAVSTVASNFAHMSVSRAHEDLLFSPNASRIGDFNDEQDIFASTRVKEMESPEESLPPNPPMSGKIPTQQFQRLGQQDQTDQVSVQVPTVQGQLSVNKQGKEPNGAQEEDPIQLSALVKFLETERLKEARLMPVDKFPLLAEAFDELLFVEDKELEMLVKEHKTDLDHLPNGFIKASKELSDKLNIVGQMFENIDAMRADNPIFHQLTRKLKLINKK